MSLPYLVKGETDLSGGSYDGIVLVSAHPAASEDQPKPFRSVLQKAVRLDKAIDQLGAVLEVNLTPERLIYSPTGPLGDYHDVRSFGEAAKKGIERALKAGVTTPLLVLPSDSRYRQCELVTLLGAMEALYVPLQLREDVPSKAVKVKQLGVYSSKTHILADVIHSATALEAGRIVARDIGGSDPERMAPPRVEEYVRKVLGDDPDIKINVVSDAGILDKEYPLFSAVDRAARVIERHRGRIIYLTYEPSGPVQQSLFLVGKGVTYDTGGADIKAGGVMAGMSRDKCGAAAVAGFMKVLSILRPNGIRVMGAMSMVRNSVGEACYVADEVIVARSKARVRIGNTDAEGRMVMGDVLAKMREIAATSENPQMMTIATLTGHACLAVGTGYSITMDNGPAHKEKFAEKLQAVGEEYGDMFEISRLRREDFEFHKGKCEGDDILQCNNKPSSQTARGHQGPGAFLVMVSGLDKNGLNSDNPIKYSHLDIAASGGDLPCEATGCPIIGLASYFLLEGKNGS